MTNHEDKRITHDDDFSKRGGYISGSEEMTIPTIPEGPGPGSASSEATSDQGASEDD